MGNKYVYCLKYLPLAFPGSLPPPKAIINVLLRFYLSKSDGKFNSYNNDYSNILVDLPK